MCLALPQPARTDGLPLTLFIKVKKLANAQTLISFPEKIKWITVNDKMPPSKGNVKPFFKWAANLTEVCRTEREIKLETALDSFFVEIFLQSY